METKTIYYRDNEFDMKSYIHYKGIECSIRLVTETHKYEQLNQKSTIGIIWIT